MVNIFICEDELKQLSWLNDVLSIYIKRKSMQAEIIAAKQNPKEIQKEIMKNMEERKLLFVDVHLPGYDMDGFELVKTLERQGIKCAYVFLTSKEEQAYKVFEYDLNILDYIIKEPDYFLKKEIGDSLEMRLDKIFQKITGMPKKKSQGKAGTGVWKQDSRDTDCGHCLCTGGKGKASD